MLLSSKQYDLSFLESQFGPMRFEFFASDDAFCYISCIACWCSTAEDVSLNWKAIQNLISVYYQPPGEIARWNIYLVFFCLESLPVLDKYIIQNDRYSARKLILDGMTELPDSNAAEALLNIQLSGTDLVLTTKDSQVEQEAIFSMSQYFSGAPLGSTSEARKKRAEIIKEIIEFLRKNENQES